MRLLESMFSVPLRPAEPVAWIEIDFDIVECRWLSYANYHSCIIFRHLAESTCVILCHIHILQHLTLSYH